MRIAGLPSSAVLMLSACILAEALLVLVEAQSLDRVRVSVAATAHVVKSLPASEHIGLTILGGVER